MLDIKDARSDVINNNLGIIMAIENKYASRSPRYQKKSAAYISGIQKRMQFKWFLCSKFIRRHNQSHSGAVSLIK
jgi:hypothetical protein